MEDKNRRKTSDDLKRRPSPQKRDENSVYSYSDGNSIDLLSMSTKNRKKQRRNVKLIITNVVLSIVLVVSSLGFAGFSLLDSRFLKRSNIDADEESGSFKDIMVSASGNVSYFLVCGLDLSENLTDIIMVVCYDLANNEASVLQIPRDTFVGTDVPTGKINAVYGNAKSGESKIKALIRCINSKFGLPIDHYATVTIQGTKNIIDIVGGVDINFPFEFKLTDDTKKNPDGSDDNEHKYVGPGEVHLDGKWGVAFVRNRNEWAQGDLGRIKAQRSFYAALLKKLTKLNFNQIASIVSQCANEVSSDITLGQMLGYAEKARGLNLDTVKIMSVPGQSGTYNAMGQSLSYYSVHKNQLVEMINKSFLPYEERAVTPDDLEIKELHSSESEGYVNFLTGGNLSAFDWDEDDTTTTNKAS